jgi:hypothetical protein
MFTPQQSYPRMQIKGALLRARFLFVVLNHGASTWNRILDKCSEQDRAALKEIAIDNWYPLGLLECIDKAIAAELGEDEQEVYTRLGEFSATSSLSGPFSSLLDPDIHSFLKQSALIHRSYQDFGTATYEPLSDTSGLQIIRYDTPPPLSYCTSGMAYFRRAIEMCGARSALISHTRCCARGDSVCEFHITWQP